MNNDYLTPGEVANALKVTPATVWRWCRENKIEHIDLPGGQYRISQATVDRLKNTVSSEK